MVVYIPAKNDEDQIKNEGLRVLRKLNTNISNTQGQLTLIRRGIWQKFEFVRDIMVVLVTDKNEGLIKTEGTKEH